MVTNQSFFHEEIKSRLIRGMIDAILFRIVFTPPLENLKNLNIQNYKFTCYFVWV